MFIAVVLIANIIFSALADRYAWYVDMTDEQIFTLSDSAKALLDQLEYDVTIIFAADRDKIEGNYSDINGKPMSYIFNTAKLMDAYSDRVSIEYHDCERNPTYFDQFADLRNQVLDGESFNANYIIIKSADRAYTDENGEEQYGFEYRVVKNENFYVTGTTKSVYAYNGEFVFASYFLQLGSEENPTVCFTTGHGEDVSNSNNLRLMFNAASFNVVDIDLATEDIPDTTRMLVINNPKSDFPGYTESLYGDVDQIQKVSDYLNTVGSVMYFTDYRYASQLTNINDLLKLWNIEMQGGVYVRDSLSSSGSADQIIRVEYNEEAEFTEELLGGAFSSVTNAKPIMSYATPIKILNGGYKQEALRTLTTQSLLTTSSSSAVVDSADSSKVVANGAQNVMALTHSTMNDSNNTFSSYLLACGSSTFASDPYLMNNGVYPNWKILYTYINMATQYQVPVDIDFKVFQSYDLDITNYQADVWTFVLTAVLPAVSAIVGAIVLIRRKYA